MLLDFYRLYKMKQPRDARNRQAKHQPEGCREQEGKHSPFLAPGFFFNRRQRRPAGEMQECKDECADSRQPSPAVFHEQNAQLLEIFKLRKASSPKVAHDDDWDDDLVGRQSQ